LPNKAQTTQKPMSEEYMSLPSLRPLTLRSLRRVILLLLLLLLLLLQVLPIQPAIPSIMAPESGSQHMRGSNNTEAKVPAVSADERQQ